MIREMDKGLIHGLEAAIIKDSLLKILDMALGKCTGNKDLIIKDNGLKEFRMVWAKFGRRVKLFKKVSIKMVNSSSIQ
jgi:predicted RecB family nuclease